MHAEAHDQAVMGEVPLMTLSEALARYHDTVIHPKGNVASAKRDKYVMDSFEKAFGPDTLLPTITAPVIDAYKGRLLEAKKAPATVNRHLAMLKAVLRRAYNEWGTLAKVPKIILLPLNNQRYRWLTEDEEARLLEVCPSHLKDVVIFLIDTGSRKGEALGLKWGDVDLTRRPGYVKFMQTKSGKPRGVPLTGRVREMLERLRAAKPEGQEHVFLYRPSNNPAEAKPVRHLFGVWKTATKNVGLKDVHIHDLRHTFASRLVMKGVPLFDVGKLLGHADIRMTMRYAHLAPDKLEYAIEALHKKPEKQGS